jgi:hypothetical protein
MKLQRINRDDCLLPYRNQPLLQSKDHRRRTCTCDGSTAKSISESSALSLPFPPLVVAAVLRISTTKGTVESGDWDAVGDDGVILAGGRDAEAGIDANSVDVADEEMTGDVDEAGAVTMRAGAEDFAFFFLRVLASDGDRERFSGKLVLMTSLDISVLILSCSRRSSSRLRYVEYQDE